MIITEQEQKTLDLYKSELAAHESELYLGSVDFIERIIQSDVSLAKKIFDKILGVKQALIKADKNNAELKRLRKAEKLWIEAAKNIVMLGS